jgi:hypothetical protein
VKRGFPILRPLFWTDGIFAVRLDEPTLRAWLERGVSHGWVVAADDEQKSLAIGKNLLAKLGGHA